MGSLIEINTDGLAKLAETICYATGLTAHGRKKMADADSYAVIRQAETEAKAELLRLKGRDEIADYIEARETRKLNNVKSVLEKASSHFTEGEKVSDEPVDADWTNRFIGIVEDISDETLQDIWGRILAGEVKQPNSYSLRTLDLLRNITKEEAELFVKASKYYIETNFICTEDFALSLHETLLLGETGLINSEDLTKDWSVEPNDVNKIPVDKQNLLILHNNTDRRIRCNISVKKLTKAGIEIMTLIENPERSEFYKSLTRFLKAKGISRITRHHIVDYDNQCQYLTLGEEL